MLLHSHALFRTSLARLLEAEPDFELAAECANAADALGRLDEVRPDVVLFDFSVWRELVDNACDSGYQGKFLAIAEDVDTALCARLLSHGVSGVFLSSDSPVRLMQAIRLVAAGDAWVDRKVIQLLANRYPHYEDLHINGLAGREQAVLKGVLDGLTNRRIADQIGASEATVKATLQQLFQKTGVRTRSQLVRIMLADAGSIARQVDSHPA
jgi:two-component system nitrate/nitrite response regulator NarL